MKKMMIKQERILICPFVSCRIADGEDKEGNLIFSEMGNKCLNCEYLHEKNSKVSEKIIYSLDENSEEYKEYERLHTPICANEKELDEDMKELQIEDVVVRKIQERCRGE